MLDADVEDLSYPHAGHFARWLFEREGAETFAALYRRAHGRKHTIAGIEELYGASLDELEAEYLAEAPYAWAPFANVPISRTSSRTSMACGVTRQ